jgi:uncharacterized protein (TIGR02302 family)
LRQLRLPLALTWSGMLAERALRAFWPLGSLLALGYAALAFGAAQTLDGRLLRALAGLTGLVLLAALGWALWRFRLPARGAALARLDETLPGRPLAALRDQMALGGPGAEQLWQAHRLRMAARAAGARAAPPRPALARRDPFGLRLLAILALTMAALYGAPSRLADLGALLPGAAPGSAQAAAAPSWEGWAEPPRYTGKPAIYLNALVADALELPQGTRLTLRLYGPPAALQLQQTVGDLPPAPGPEAMPATDLRSITFAAERSGTLAVTGPGGRSFALTVLPDAPPQVAPVGSATRRADGTFAQPFRAADDFGVLRGTATLELDLATTDRRFGLALDPEPRPPLVFDLPLPIRGNRTDFTEILVEDAARHPFANLPVRMTLAVSDGLEQTGQSETLTLDLPGRRFFDPLAAALVEMRRDLLWTRENGPRVAQILRAISHRPGEGDASSRVFLMLGQARAQLESGLAAGALTAPLRDELAEALWQMAVLQEDGGLDDALAAMQRAQERLSEAIRNGASPDEIARLMQELKDATDDYIRMLAERAEQSDQDQFAQGQQGTPITGDQIQQMMDEIQRLMEEGRMAEAQELLNQLSRMLENLRVTRGEGGEGSSPGEQALRDLGETLRNQQGLSDEVFNGLQDPQQGQQGQGQAESEGGEGQGGNNPGAGQGSNGPDGLAERQRALRERLGYQQELLPGDGTAGGDSVQQLLDQAGRAMDQAEQALREGDGSTALDRQADAMEALREGMRALSDALAQNDQQEDGERTAQPDASASAATRDPLGRQFGDGGRAGTDETMLQGDDVYRRARDLLDEIRRRSGERLRPELELDYLRRLLTPF